jgi:hypothetical protein
LKRTNAVSEQYISQMSGVLLTSDAETVITKMLDFGPDKRLLKFHLQLLRSCNKLGINKAYSRINRSIWDNTGHKRH